MSAIVGLLFACGAIHIRIDRMVFAIESFIVDLLVQAACRSLTLKRRLSID
jgi:hypothetical protein